MNYRSFFIYSRQIIVFLFIFIAYPSCDKMPESVKEWQKEQLKKRYGSAYQPDSKKIEDWEKDVLKFEKIIDEKVKAGEQAAKFYRKIGQSYGEVGMHEKCVENLKKAINAGYTAAEVFYALGLCQGSLARKHNWEYSLTREAEKSFLKALNLKEKYTPAMFQLGLVYYYGFGNSNKYSILYGQKNIEIKHFRQKGLSLIEKYARLENDDVQAKFALGGIYHRRGLKLKATGQYQQAVRILIKNFPENYQEMPEYEQAMHNLANINRGNQPLNKKKDTMLFK